MRDCALTHTRRSASPTLLLRSATSPCRVPARGGRVSMARHPDGTEDVYALNTNLRDALVDPNDQDPDAAAVVHGLAAHAILLSLVGVPAIYCHALLGSGQDRAGMEASDIPRRINREVLDADRLAEKLATSPRRSGMREGLMTLLEMRREMPAFSPFADQRVEILDPRVFVVRPSAGTPNELIAAITVSDEVISLPSLARTDVISGRSSDVIELDPFGYTRSPFARASLTLRNQPRSTGFVRVQSKQRSARFLIATSAQRSH